MKNSFRSTIRVSNWLGPDQARHFVGPDLGPHCLQTLSADDTLAAKESTQSAHRKKHKKIWNIFANINLTHNRPRQQMYYILRENNARYFL